MKQQANMSLRRCSDTNRNLHSDAFAASNVTSEVLSLIKKAQEDNINFSLQPVLGVGVYHQQNSRWRIKLTQEVKYDQPNIKISHTIRLDKGPQLELESMATTISRMFSSPYTEDGWIMSTTENGEPRTVCSKPSDSYANWEFSKTMSPISDGNAWIIPKELPILSNVLRKDYDGSSSIQARIGEHLYSVTHHEYEARASAHAAPEGQHRIASFDLVKVSG